MAVSKELLGEQIKAAREAKRWRQEDLGKLCGVRKSQISKIEKDVSHASMPLFLKICDVLGFDPAIPTQQNVQAEPIEAVNERVWVSLPYAANSIQKVSSLAQGAYFDLIIYSNDGLLFCEEQVVFTKGPHLPVLEEEQIQTMNQARDKTTTKLVISIPNDSGSIKKVSFIIAGNYLHLVLHGSVISTFDESKVQFARSQE